MKAQVLASPTSTPLPALGPAPGMPFRPQLQPRPSQPCLLGPLPGGQEPTLRGGPAWGLGAEDVVPPPRWRKGWSWAMGAFQGRNPPFPCPPPPMAGSWGVKGGGCWLGEGAVSRAPTVCLAPPHAGCSPAPRRGQRRPWCQPRWPGADRWSCSSSGSCAPAERRRGPHCCCSTRRRGLPGDRTLAPAAGTLYLPRPPAASARSRPCRMGHSALRPRPRGPSLPGLPATWMLTVLAWPAQSPPTRVRTVGDPAPATGPSMC